MVALLYILTIMAVAVGAKPVKVECELGSDCTIMFQAPPAFKSIQVEWTNRENDLIASGYVVPHDSFSQDAIRVNHQKQFQDKYYIPKGITNQLVIKKCNPEDAGVLIVNVLNMDGPGDAYFRFIIIVYSDPVSKITKNKNLVDMDFVIEEPLERINLGTFKTTSYPVSEHVCVNHKGPPIEIEFLKKQTNQDGTVTIVSDLNVVRQRSLKHDSFKCHPEYQRHPKAKQQRKYSRIEVDIDVQYKPDKSEVMGYANKIVKCDSNELSGKLFCMPEANPIPDYWLKVIEINTGTVVNSVKGESGSWIAELAVNRTWLEGNLKDYEVQCQAQNVHGTSQIIYPLPSVMACNELSDSGFMIKELEKTKTFLQDENIRVEAELSKSITSNDFLSKLTAGSMMFGLLCAILSTTVIVLKKHHAPTTIVPIIDSSSVEKSKFVSPRHFADSALAETFTPSKTPAKSVHS